MSHKLYNNFRLRIFLIFVFLLILLAINVNGQSSGFIWIKTFEPGSANLNDATIDKKALSFVDSLMKRQDIEVIFLGGSDNLPWKLAKNVPELSNAFDQAKKLERASKLRERYGKGEIGITNEPIRGVKVVWHPKKPDVFKMKNQINHLSKLADSMKTDLLALTQNQQQEIRELKEKIISTNTTSSAFFDWEFKSGFFLWSAGSPFDLAVPYFGIALKRNLWSFEIQGGLTPWSRSYRDGNRSDAFLMGTMNVVPASWYAFKFGVFSGWEFLTNTDNWTMKVMGITAGPNLQLKFMNIYLGYNISKLYTLTDSPRWVNSISFAMSFNIKLN